MGSRPALLITKRCTKTGRHDIAEIALKTPQIKKIKSDYSALSEIEVHGDAYKCYDVKKELIISVHFLFLYILINSFVILYTVYDLLIGV